VNKETESTKNVLVEDVIVASPNRNPRICERDEGRAITIHIVGPWGVTVYAATWMEGVPGMGSEMMAAGVGRVELSFVLQEDAEELYRVTITQA
jgi:hypothetical protein